MPWCCRFPNCCWYQKRLLAVLSAPILHIVQAFSCNHRANCLNLQGYRGGGRGKRSHNLKQSTASLSGWKQCHCQKLQFMASSVSWNKQRFNQKPQQWSKKTVCTSTVCSVRGEAAITIRWGCWCCLSRLSDCSVDASSISWLLVKGWQWHAESYASAVSSGRPLGNCFGSV